MSNFSLFTTPKKKFKTLACFLSAVLSLNPMTMAQTAPLLTEGTLTGAVSPTTFEESMNASSSTQGDTSANFFMPSPLSAATSSERMKPLPLHTLQKDQSVDMGSIRVTLRQANATGKYSYDVYKINSDSTAVFQGNYEAISAGGASAKVGSYTTASGRNLLVLNLSYYTSSLQTSLMVVDIDRHQVLRLHGDLESAAVTSDEQLKITSLIDQKPWAREEVIIDPENFTQKDPKILDLDLSLFSKAPSNPRFGFRYITNSGNGDVWMIDYEAYAQSGELPVRVGGGSVVRHSPYRMDVSADGAVMVIAYRESGAAFLSGSGYAIHQVSDLKRGILTPLASQSGVETQNFVLNQLNQTVSVTAKVRQPNGTIETKVFIHAYKVHVPLLNAPLGIPVAIGNLQVTLEQLSPSGIYSYRVSRKNTNGSLTYLRNVDLYSAPSASSSKLSYYKTADGRELLVMSFSSSTGLGGRSSVIKVMDVKTRGIVKELDGELFNLSVYGNALNLSVNVFGKPWTQERRSVSLADYSLTEIKALNLDVSRFTPADSNSRFGFQTITDSQNASVWMIDIEAYAATGELPVRVGGGSVVRHNPYGADVSPDGTLLVIAYHESGAAFLSGSGFGIHRVSDLKRGISTPIQSGSRVDVKSFVFDDQSHHVAVLMDAPANNCTGLSTLCVKKQVLGILNTVNSHYVTIDLKDPAKDAAASVVFIADPENTVRVIYQSGLVEKFNTESGNITERRTTTKNAAGQRTRLVVERFHNDGVTKSEIFDIRYSALTGLITHRYLTYNNALGQRERYASYSYQADGEALAQVSDFRYNAETGLLSQRYSYFYDEQGRKTRSVSNSYQADGVTLAAVSDTRYIPETGRAQNRFISYYDLQGQKTRYLSQTFNADGKTFKRVSDIRYDVTTGKRTLQYTSLYDSLGNRTNYLSDVYYSDGDSLARRTAITYNPANGAVINTSTTCFSQNGSTIVCS